MQHPHPEPPPPMALTCREARLLCPSHPGPAPDSRRPPCSPGPRHYSNQPAPCCLPAFTTQALPALSPLQALPPLDLLLLPEDLGGRAPPSPRCHSVTSVWAGTSQAFQWVRIHFAGFPGGPVGENLPADARDTGSTPGLGGSHVSGQVSPHTTTEPTCYHYRGSRA